MKKGLYIVPILFSVLLISLVSAGFFDSVKNILTGQAIENQTVNVSVTIQGVDPVTIGPVDTSALDGTITPIEDGSVNAPIYVTVCDPNGVNDINDSSVTVTYSNATYGESRSNYSCVNVSDLDGQCANFSCNVTMYYWDVAGIWNINVTASDLGNGSTVYNDSQTFQYNELKALVISTTQLNWTGIYPAANNETPDNDPTIVNNTGNYNQTISLLGLDLHGLTITDEEFGVGNFTAEVVNASCGTGDSVYLVNDSIVSITSSEANKGNLTSGSGSGQEEVYYCIPTVPQLSTQEYSTYQIGSWIVSYAD